VTMKASFVTRDIDQAILDAARDRARDAGTSLADVLREYIEAYAAGGSPAAQLGAKGGSTRASRMTAEERSASARHAALARHRG